MVYWIGLLFTLVIGFLIFRVIVRRDYEQNGKLGALAVASASDVVSSSPSSSPAPSELRLRPVTDFESLLPARSRAISDKFFQLRLLAVASLARSRRRPVESRSFLSESSATEKVSSTTSLSTCTSLFFDDTGVLRTLLLWKAM